jgi:hypothetical protein
VCLTCADVDGERASVALVKAEHMLVPWPTRTRWRAGLHGGEAEDQEAQLRTGLLCGAGAPLRRGSSERRRARRVPPLRRGGAEASTAERR